MKERSDQRKPGDESLLAGMADDYVARLKRGEAPSEASYVARHPELAAEIRAMLPTLRAMTIASAEEESDPLEEWLEDRTLGDFRIIREIGRGGMGTVYEAEQISLGRRVALKVLPLAALLDARLLQRFKHEAQAAAQLHHEHIVPIHAVGCERGVHYYAMSYIEGATLAEVIAELRARKEREAGGEADGADGSAATLARQLTEGTGPANGGNGWGGPGARSRAFFRSVAWLGQQAAEALEHAHAVGVIHRDIKPSNLLLDEQGRLWVADFGLTHYRAAESSALTLTGDVLGTARYMSPEQASGRSAVMDQRTDLYSLGATLYELLCLRPAFAESDRRKLLRQVVEEEPVPPRRLNPAIPVDLETILLKAMAKDPAERYTTAAELAADFGRFLAHRPILAHRPGIVPRLRRWTQRHVGLVGAGLAGLLLAIGGLGVTNWLLTRERNATREQRDLALREQQRADANYHLALQVLERGVLDVLNDRLPRQGRMTDGDRRLLQQALDFYEGFLAQNEGSLEARAAVGHAYHRVARIQRELGQFAAAETAYARSRRVFETLLRENPEAQKYRSELISLWVEYGRMLNEAGRHQEAQTAARRALEEARKPRSSDAASSPTEREILSAGQGLLGATWLRLGRPEQAAKAYAARLAQTQPDAETGQPRILAAWADSHRGLGEAALARTNWTLAESHFRAALRGRETLRPRQALFPADRAARAAAQAGLATALQAQGRLPEAERAAWDAFAEQRALAEEFPGQPAYRLDLIQLSARMARLFMAEGRRREAKRRLNEALEWWTRLPLAVQRRAEALEIIPDLYQARAELFAGQGQPAVAARRAAPHRSPLVRAPIAHVSVPRSYRLAVCLGGWVIRRGIPWRNAR